MAALGVSICIPVRNAAAWLAQCLDSCLRQSEPVSEILVADDASTDQTVAVAQGYARFGVQVLQNEQVLGRYGNQNRVMLAAHNPLLLKLDGDDWLEPNYLATLLPAFYRYPRLGLAIGGFAWWSETGQALGHELPRVAGGLHPGRQLFWNLLQGNWVKGSAVLLRRAAFVQVKGCDPTFRYNGDWWLYLKLLRHWDFWAEPRVLANYRWHGQEKSARSLWEAQDHWRVVELLPTVWGADLPPLPKVLPTLRRRYAWLLATYSALHASPSVLPAVLAYTLRLDQSWQTRLAVLLAQVGVWRVLKLVKDRLQIGTTRLLR